MPYIVKTMLPSLLLLVDAAPVGSPECKGDNDNGGVLSNTVFASDDACRNLRRKVVAFYCNPIFPKGSIYRPLASLTRDMRNVVMRHNPLDFSIIPAAQWIDVKAAMKLHTPTVLIWSGHTVREWSADKRCLTCMAFEDERGRCDMHYVTGSMLEGALRCAPTVRLVCLMGCSTTAILSDVSDDMKNDCCFITWSTIVEDNAAATFAEGMIDALDRMFPCDGRTESESDNLNASMVFTDGVHKYLDEGYIFADPRFSLNPLARGQVEFRESGTVLTGESVAYGRRAVDYYPTKTVLDEVPLDEVALATRRTNGG